MFTVLLLVIVPLALVSPSLFSDVPLSYLPKSIIYIIAFSLILGIMFLVASAFLSIENKKRIEETIEAGSPADGVIFFIPYIIYLAIKQIFTR